MNEFAGITPDGAFDGQDMRVDKTLELFSAIEDQQQVTQNLLATRLGVAVGLTNAYIRRCVRKGWIKVQKIPSRRYAYFLTPKGFVEKSRLTAEYLSHSLGFFRRARSQCSDLFQGAQKRLGNRFVIYGLGDLTEIAILAAMECDVEIIAVVAPGSNREKIAGVRIVGSLEEVVGYDAVMITDIASPKQSYTIMREKIGDERILLPPVLHVTRDPK